VADQVRIVPMTEEQKKIKELEHENTILRTYFRVCAENETDLQKKRFYEQLANAEDLEFLSRNVSKD